MIKGFKMTKKSDSYDTEGDISLPLLKILLIGEGILFAFQIIFIPSVIYTSLILASVFSVLLGLGVIIVGSMKIGPSSIFVGILAIVAGLLPGYFWQEYITLKSGDIVHGISIKEAHNYPKGTIFYFSDGIPLIKYLGEFVEVTESGKPRSRTYSYYYVVPVVTKDWSRDQPVLLWAGSSTSAFNKNWRKPHRAGLRLISGAFRNAQKNAESKHRLYSHSDAPIIEWMASPTEELEYKWKVAWAAVIMWHAAWIVGMVLYRIFSGNGNEEI